jgi:hypothetical protein
MAARAAKIRGGKVEIRKEHIEIYKVTHFQNSESEKLILCVLLSDES